MRSSSGRINLAAVISVPAAILVATAITAALGRQLSIWTIVIALLLVGMFWAVVARLRPRVKPVPERPRTVWRIQRSGIDEVPLLGVAFVDASRGWVVGGRGTILATSDGGETWSRQDSGSAAELNAVAFASASRGWAVGNDESGRGTVLSTFDGGVTWCEQVTSATILSHLAFPDDTHGWVVGGSGTILVTRNGGETWQAQRPGGTESFLGVTFVDASRGWLVGVDGETNTGIILATTDGGETWQARNSGGSAPLRAVSFADAVHGWAVGEAGAVLATSDGGETWKAQSLGGSGGGQFAPTLYAVAFADATHGWAVGYDSLGESGMILTTIDGGGTWFKTPGRGGLYALAFPDPTYGWATGYEDDPETGSETGLILAATEGGGE